VQVRVKENAGDELPAGLPFSAIITARKA
jgi:hypothetical protein